MYICIESISKTQLHEPLSLSSAMPTDDKEMGKSKNNDLPLPLAAHFLPFIFFHFY